MLANGVVVAQQLIAAQHQFAKVHHTFALALVFVELVHLDLLAGVRVAGDHVFGTQPLLFATRNEPHQLLGRKALIVNLELLAQPLDGGELILGIQNLKSLGQPCRLVVCPQEAVAQAVEGANPHAAHIHRQHGAEPRHHLLGGLVGKRHRQNATGRNIAVLQQPGDAGGQHPRLARARASQDQRVLCGKRNGSTLLGVEGGKQRGL